MVLKPAFKRGWRVIKRTDGTVYIGRSMQFYKVSGLDGEVCDIIVPLLDGTRTIPEVVSEAVLKTDKISPSDCYAAIQAFEEAGVLYENEVPIPDELSDRDINRYDRQIRFWVGYETKSRSRYDIQLALKKSRVAIVGLGGGGSWIAYTLVGAGVGSIVGIDPDNVETSNLNRQILYDEESIGLPKVKCAEKSLTAFNSELDFIGIQEAIVDFDSAIRLLKGNDFVVLAADHPPRYLRRWIASACWELKIPYVILGGTLLGPLVVPGQTGCFGCYEAFLREHDSDYDYFVEQLVHSQPTHTAPAFMSPIIGGLIAKDVILFLAGVGTPSTLGKVVRFDWNNATSQAMQIQRRKDCRICAE